MVSTSSSPSPHGPSVQVRVLVLKMDSNPSCVHCKTRVLYHRLMYCYKIIVFSLSTLNMTAFFEFLQFTGTRGHHSDLHCQNEFLRQQSHSLVRGITYPLLSVLLVYLLLEGQLAALILEIV